MLRFSMAAASGGGYFGRKLRTNRLKFSYSCRCASVAIVSKTIDDLPEPETPVKIVICRFGMRRVMFLRLFSRAPRISMNSVMSVPVLLRRGYVGRPVAFAERFHANRAAIG